jgi:hypothetical protein
MWIKNPPPRFVLPVTRELLEAIIKTNAVIDPPYLKWWSKRIAEPIAGESK